MKRMVAMLVGALVVWTGGALAWASGPPFAPEVTPRENRILQQALQIAETNRLAAVARLDRVEERGAALAFTAGNLLFQAEDYAGAERSYREALAQLPRFRGALSNLGRILLLQERPDEAIALYQQLVADGQADADVLLLLGHALLLQNYPVSAESAYRQSLLLQPQSREARTGLAKTLFLQERFEEALSLSREILGQAPSQKELWSLRVNAYLQAGRHADALHAIEMARRLGVAGPDLLATMGDLLLNAEQPDDALRIYREALATGQLGVERMLRAIDGFLLTDDLAAAEQMIAQVEEQVTDPEMEIALLRYRTRIAWQRGDAERASTLAQSVLQHDPLDGQMLLLLAEIYQAAGDWQQALIQAERAERISGMEADALVQQALIMVARKRHEEAVPLLEAAQVYREQPHVGRYLQQLRRMQP